jgi:hypothetical protein
MFNARYTEKITILGEAAAWNIVSLKIVLVWMTQQSNATSWFHSRITII